MADGYSLRHSKCTIGKGDVTSTRGVKLNPDNVQTNINQLYVKDGAKSMGKRPTSSIDLEITAYERVQLCNSHYHIPLSV